jgi:hypothetical protein
MRFAMWMVWSWLWFALPAHAQDTNIEATRERRIGVETAVTLSATAVALGGGLGAAAITMNNCQEQSFLIVGLGCSWRAHSVMMGVTFGLLPLALTMGSYFPHRGLGGKGRWYAALAGAAVGIGGGLGIVSMPASSKDGGAPLVAGAVVGALVAAAMPILALELSHGRQQRRERDARARRFTPVASSLPHGAWIGVAGTL